MSVWSWGLGVGDDTGHLPGSGSSHNWRESSSEPEEGGETPAWLRPRAWRLYTGSDIGTQPLPTHVTTPQVAACPTRGPSQVTSLTRVLQYTEAQVWEGMDVIEAVFTPWSPVSARLLTHFYLNVKVRVLSHSPGLLFPAAHSWPLSLSLQVTRRFCLNIIERKVFYLMNNGLLLILEYDKHNCLIGLRYKKSKLYLIFGILLLRLFAQQLH